MKIILALSLFAFNPYAFSKNNSKILIFGKTIRPAHADIIPGAIRGLAQLLTDNGFQTHTTQDQAIFTTDSLLDFSAIVLIDVSEGVLSEAQKKVIENSVEQGKGLVAIHASISAGKDWPWFKNKIGTLFLDQPPIQKASVQVVNTNHPSMSLLPESWIQADEWYNFTTALGSEQAILAVVDEATYSGGKMGALHPIIWKYEKDKIRIWYTAKGHTEVFYTDKKSELSRQILGAVKWASRN